MALTLEEVQAAWEWGTTDGYVAPRQPTFVSQVVFRTAVLYAEARGVPATAFLGPGPFIVHPDALAWYEGRLARARMLQHFGMLDS